MNSRSCMPMIVRAVKLMPEEEEMPNWAMGECSAVLPTRNVEKFKSYFLSQTAEENEDKKKYFARTFVDNVDGETNRKGMTLLHVSFYCAWGIYPCMVEIPDDPKCIKMEDAIKECEVKRLIVHSYEKGMGFEESLVFDRDEGNEVLFESRDLYKDPWNEFLDEDDMDEEMKGEEECQIG